jgi:hypothetical protein
MEITLLPNRLAGRLEDLGCPTHRATNYVE